MNNFICPGKKNCVKCSVCTAGARRADLQVQMPGISSRDMSADAGRGGYGVAADLGTTTVALYLYALETGALVDCAGVANPQRIHGADIISRINYAIENAGGLNKLQGLILDCLSGLIDELCAKNNVARGHISSLVFAGNTVMQSMAAGVDPRTIAVAPFTPPDLFGREIQARELFDGLDGGASIYFAPCFAGYVGGDVAAGVIAADIDLSAKTRLYLDVGTNGEIGLGNRDGLLFCAAAAGPAFEGAHIECGMAGVPGAVNKVALADGAVSYETIGGGTPAGICGSGLIDACAVMLELGVLDETGLLAESFKICEGVYISRKDIRELQLAKAAIAAGISTLMHYAGKNLGEVDELILAGGFGAHIDKKNACRIGLIPPELEGRIITAGNAAGTGASAVLLNKRARGRIKNLPGMSGYVELSGDAFFMQEYVERMMF